MLAASPGAIKLLHYIQSTTEISPYHVIDDLLQMKSFPKTNDSFIVVANRVKIPVRLCSHLPRQTAKDLLMAICPLVGTSWALTNKNKSPAHRQLYEEMHYNISHSLHIETLFRIECYAIRQFVLRFSVLVKGFPSRHIDILIENAVNQPWNLSFGGGTELANLCQILDVACVKSTQEDASFIIDGQIFIKCCKRDKILLLIVSLARLPKFKKLTTDLSYISSVSTLAAQLNPSMESPGSITESPNKRQREDEEFAKKRSKQYNPKDKKKYTDEEWRLVEEVQGKTLLIFANLYALGYTIRFKRV